MAKTLDRYYRIVRKPRVTEKGLKAVERGNAYSFQVNPDANKVEIRQAIEALFNVKVAAVRTMNMMGKSKRMGRHVGRRPAWKKAVVKLQSGYAIEDFY
jgi:large subunit ribosomal protein L23